IGSARVAAGPPPPGEVSVCDVSDCNPARTAFLDPDLDSAFLRDAPDLASAAAAAECDTDGGAPLPSPPPPASPHGMHAQLSPPPPRRWAQRHRHCSPPLNWV
ncbi:hypothetical protein Vretimale_9910, partial [Volvox reticuliferus]